MSRLINISPMDMISKIKIIQTNETRLLRFYADDANVHVRLRKNHANDGIMEGVSELGEGLCAGQCWWNAVLACYDCASVLVKDLHGSLKPFAALLSEIEV